MVTTDAHSALAAQVGLGDPLPMALCRMVDDAFWKHYDDNVGRHAAAITLTLGGSEVVQGHTYEGDAVEIVATASTNGRTVRERLALLDLWRLPAAGLELLAVEPAEKAIAFCGIAETWHEGHLWTALILDQRGAPIVLIDPATFAELMVTGNDRRRVETVTKSVGGPENVRAIAASTAQEYLAEQREVPSDDGAVPLWWALYRLLPDIEVVASPGPLVGTGKPRRYALRGKVASEITRDATGKARTWAKGSTWRTRQLEQIDEMAPVRGEEDDNDDPGSVGRPPSTTDGHLIEWRDDTGDTGAKLGDGDVTLAEVVGKFLGPHRAISPANAHASTAFGEVIDRLREIGLTNRQAFILANAKAGFSYADIASEFNCTVSTVANTVRTAQAKVDSAKQS